jgi:hypothetical protein
MFVNPLRTPSGPLSDPLLNPSGPLSDPLLTPFWPPQRDLLKLSVTIKDEMKLAETEGGGGAGGGLDKAARAVVNREMAALERATQSTPQFYTLINGRKVPGVNPKP